MVSVEIRTLSGAVRCVGYVQDESEVLDLVRVCILQETECSSEEVEVRGDAIFARGAPMGTVSYARVAQTVEVNALEACQSGFESPRGYQSGE